MRRKLPQGVSPWLPLLVAVAACSGEVGDPSGAGPYNSDDPSLGAGGGDADGSTAGETSGSSGATTAGSGGVAEDDDDAVVDAIANAAPLPLVLDGKPAFARVIRLTHEQWENSTRYLLGLDDTNQQQNLADDASAVTDFSNHEGLLLMNANLYRDYQMAAEELAAAIGIDAAAIGNVYQGQDAQGFIDTVGRRAFRRPLTSEEASGLRTLYDEGAALTENGSTPHARGAALVLQALLQAPQFLYRTEMGEAGERLSGFELAAKLSLLLLGTTPDDDLLDAAERGQLDNDEGLRSIASQMLEEGAVIDVMRHFHGELLHFSNYLNIVKDAEEVPEYDPALNAELEEASYLFFDRIFNESLGVKDILTSTVGYVGPQMAPLYGEQVVGNRLQEVDLGPERPGFFTHLPFLILNSQNLLSDPIHRGVALNFKVLCGEIPLPGMVETTLPPFEPGQTNRERVDAGSGPGSCGAPCHAPYINPLGFAFENFDGLGRLRETDNGKAVDTRAQYPFTEGNKEFSGAAELMSIMAQGEQAHACYSKNLATFALQRELTAEDKPLVDALTSDSRDGASVKELLVALVSNSAFTTRAVGGEQ